MTEQEARTKIRALMTAGVLPSEPSVVYRGAGDHGKPLNDPESPHRMGMTFSEVSALEDTMLSDEQRREDQAEGMVSIECPAGAHIAMRMSIERVEKADEHVGIKCQECGHIFDWEAPKSS